MKSPPRLSPTLGSIAIAVFCCAVLTSGAASAQVNWKRVGTVSTLTNGQLCKTDGTNVICDSTTPSISASNFVGIGSTLPTVSLDDSQNPDAIALPGGSNAQRPTGAALVNGEIRYNNTGTGTVEAYYNGAWNSLVTSATLGTSTPAAGSTGYVQFNSGGYLGASSNLFWNNSSGYLGIGTTSPAAKLDVNGGIDITGVNGISFPADYTAGASVAIGSSALGSQAAATAGVQANTAIGYQAMSSVSLGTAALNNTAVGYQALKADTTGGSNSAFGYQALKTNTTGSNNTANGFSSLYSNTTGQSNTANGFSSLYSNTTGQSNTANGFSSLYSNTTGQANTANGMYALYANTGGSSNTAIGYQALHSNANGVNNTALGYFAGYDVSSGGHNVILGDYSTTGVGVTTGSNNILIGQDVRPPSQTASNQLNIGNLIYATGLGSGTTVSTGNIGIGSTIPVSSLDLSQKNDAVALPGGSSASRPTAVNGMIRYNSGTPGLEAYFGSAWNTLLTSATAGTSTPAAGSSGQMQYNNGGVLGGAAGVSYASSGNILTTQAQGATDTPLVVKGVGGAALPSGVGGYWKFDENSGTSLSDASGNGNTGTFNGTTGSQWVTGKINSGLTFNGSNNTVTIPSSSSINPTAALTVSMWVKVASGNFRGTLYYGSGCQCTVYTWDDGNMYFDIGFGAGQWNAHEVSVPYSNNVWMHIVAVYDGSYLRIYKNGVAGTPLAYNTAFSNSGTATFGGAITDYTGVIDEVGIWDRALSSAEVTALYNSGSGIQYPFTGTVIAQTGNLASFVTNAGTTLADVDASGNIATTGNMTASGTVAVGTASIPTGVTANVNGAVKVSGTGSEPCTAAQVGAIRYNPSGNYFELCSYP
jgi:hypothetical protein